MSVLGWKSLVEVTAVGVVNEEEAEEEGGELVEGMIIVTEVDIMDGVEGVRSKGKWSSPIQKT